MMHWSPSVVSGLDPATVSGWSKAVVTAATVAAAGLGAGAAVKSPHALHEVMSQGRSIVGLGHVRGAPESARAPSASGVGATSVGLRRAAARDAAAIAGRTTTAPSHGTTAAPRGADASPHGLPDAATRKLTQPPEPTLPARGPEVVAGPDRTASGGLTKGAGPGSVPVGGGSADESGSAAPTGPLSLVDAILTGKTGAASTQTQPSAGTATDDDHVSATSESSTSSDEPGSVSSSGAGVSAHREPLSTTVGDVLGAVTGAL